MKKKRKYQKPCIEIISMQSDGFVMIPVSGKTTPEDSQAKESFYWMDGEGGNPEKTIPSNLWDD